MGLLMVQVNSWLLYLGRARTSMYDGERAFACWFVKPLTAGVRAAGFSLFID